MSNMRYIAASFLLVFALAVPAMARSSTTITANPVHYGDTLTVHVVTTAEHSVTALSCSQGGVVVLSGLGLAHYATAYTETATLSSLAYTGGAAACTVTVRTWGNSTDRFRTIGSLSFTVQP